MIALALLSATLQDVSVTYEPFSGLQVKLQGVPVIVGSSFRYYDPASGQSLYSSRWAPKEVVRLPDGSIRVRYSGDNGNAIGTHTYLQTAKGLTVRYEFRWRGSKDVRVDTCYAQIWAPAVAHGSVEIGGSMRNEFLRPLNGDWSARRLGSSQAIRFDSSLADILINTRGSNTALYDARSYPQDWAKGNCLFWLGNQSIPVKPGQTTEVTIDWTFDPKFRGVGKDSKESLEGQTVPDAQAPPAAQPVLVPKPKEQELLGSYVGIREGSPSDEVLTRRWAEQVAEKWRLDPGEIHIDVSAAKSVSDLPEEGFEVSVTAQGVRIGSRDEAGLDYALQTLANLVQVRSGRLALPCGRIKDWPTVKSRGAHFFVGNGALPFQREWIRKVLAPLRFNNAVVECSRVQWDALPQAESESWASKAEVSELFEVLRKHHIEPIPLIQSLGHMDWLLSGTHRRLAVNSEVPYTLDSRKVRAKELIKGLWEEAFLLLEPKIAHFGLDEISMRGMPEDPTLAARLWAAQVPALMSLAKAHRVKPMLWGDMMLTKVDAPDAAHAVSPETASQFRAVVQPEAIVGDWHYLPTTDPNKFKSLELWKSWGMHPVATSWYRPDNIRSHTIKAIEQGAGTLQCLWAGYATNSQSLLSETDQFAAHVLAADYSWSGRTEPIASVGYDPAQVLRRMMFAWPTTAKALPGQYWSPSGVTLTGMRFDNVGVMRFSPRVLRSPLSSEGLNGHQSLSFSVKANASEVFLLVDCIGWLTDGDQAAEVIVTTTTGSVKSLVLYGADVRAQEDARPAVRLPSKAGLSLLRIPLGATQEVTNITLSPVSQTAGVRLHGVTTL